MEDTLTIVIKLDGKEIYVNLEAGKVIAGSVHGAFENKKLVVGKEFDLCGYPYVELEEDNSEGVGVPA
jgi:hypothetical protein